MWEGDYSCCEDGHEECVKDLVTYGQYDGSSGGLGVVVAVGQERMRHWNQRMPSVPALALNVKWNRSVLY
jgi:hypothetical protein